MKIDNSTKSIRDLTRLALPADDFYIFRLGVALYSFASLCGFMAEVACHLDSTKNRSKIEALTGGGILQEFQSAVKASIGKFPEVESIGKEAADLFGALNSERSDIIHSYPITNPSDHQQILHRRLDAKNKRFEVTNEFLDKFISRLEFVSDQLYKIRDIVRPDI